MRCTVLMVVLPLSLAIIHCSGTKPTVRVTHSPDALQTFSPLPIDTAKIDKGDLSELEKAVNDSYASSSSGFGNARITKQEGNYVYVHVFSLQNENSCYKITVDKSRCKIVDMQPDCPR